MLGMEAWLDPMLALLALPKFGLSTVFIVAFISATLLPLGSEPVVFGLVKLNPDLFWPAILVATAGNTLGGVVTWWMGYGAERAVERVRHRPVEHRALAWLQRFGLAPAGAGGDVPRQQVLVGRMHVRRVRRLAPVVEQRVPLACRRVLGEPAAEGRGLGDLRRICRRAATAREHAAQVVRDAAAAHHEHAVAPERRQRFAERELLRR